MNGKLCIRAMLVVAFAIALTALPISAQEFENEVEEGLGAVTMAIMVLASLILPYNLLVKAMRKGGLEFLGLDAQQLNKIAGDLSKAMTVAHLTFGTLLLVAATWHTLGTIDSVSYKPLHWAALAGVYALVITGVVARYVPMPGKAKRPLRTFHNYILFAIVAAMLALAHVFVGD